MSLADGFSRVDKEVDRRASDEFKYLERVFASKDHEFNLGLERSMLAFGCVPFRARPQGTVSRKLENRPRLIGDLGGNRKVLYDFIGKHVGIVNELVRNADFPKMSRLRFRRTCMPTVSYNMQRASGASQSSDGRTTSKTSSTTLAGHHLSGGS